MRRGTFDALIEASSTGQDEFSEGFDRNNINPLVAEAIGDVAQSKRAEVKTQIAEALRLHEKVRDANIDVIRTARRTEAIAKKNLSIIDEAKETALKDGDFRPLLVAVGVLVPGYTPPAK
jgi:hypothetical protein